MVHRPPGHTASNRACDRSQPDLAFLPADLVRAGFKLVEPPKRFVGDQLFDLIDGGAIQYFDYGFIWAVAGTYVHERGGRLTAELYSMATSAQALALFQARDVPSAERVDVGDGARMIEATIEVHDACCLLTVSSVEPGEKGRDLALLLGCLILSELHRE
jgi:hypothetical protein